MLVVVEVYFYALPVVEVLQVVHGGVFICEFAGLAVDDVGIGYGCFDAIQEGVGVLLGGRTAVIAVEEGGIVGIGSHHCDGLHGLGQRQGGLTAGILVVGQQHHRLACRLCGEGVVFLAADYLRTKVGPWKLVCGVEHAQFEAAQKGLTEVVVEHALLDEPFIQCLGEHHEHLAALQVGAVEYSVDGCRQRVGVGLVLPLVVEVVDGVAVGEHDGVVAPFAAQDVHEQTVAGAAGLALITVVGTHHLAHITFLHQSLEGGEVGLPQVAH